MPFKSPEQEAAMFANPESREVAKKWVKEYGHAPGWEAYLKRRKKKSEFLLELVRIADELDKEGFIREADLIDNIIFSKKKGPHKTPWGKEKFYRCVKHVLDSGITPKKGDTKEEAAAAICGSVMWGPISRKRERKKKEKKAAVETVQRGKCPQCGADLEPFTTEENVTFDYCPICEEVVIPDIDNRDVLSYTIPDGDYANY